jgi:Spy/CpxP family protein refolding chaperone
MRAWQIGAALLLAGAGPLAVLLDHHAGMRRDMAQHKMGQGGGEHDGGGAGKPAMNCPMMRPDSATTPAPKHNP